MKPRPSWTAKQRAEIFRDAKGVCHLCTRRIAPGEVWQVEHPKARGLGGSDKQEDMRPAHYDCHQPKTKADNKIMRKADAQMKKHFGLNRQSISQRKAFQSKFKRKVSGEVVLR